MGGSFIIKGVPEPPDLKANSNSGPEPASQPASSPLVLIPVTAEDVARKTRRVRLIWISALVAVAAIAGWMYKRSSDPIHAQQAYDAAQRLFAVARYDQVIVSCDRAVGLKPDYTEAYELRGRAHSALYDSEAAVADYSKAVSLKPTDPGILLDRAGAYLDQKHYQEALADTASALALDSKLALAHNMRGTALRATDQAQQALEEFTKAVELAPNSDNYYQRGATYQALNDHHHAVEDFTQAISFDPDKSQAYFARAESERALGDSKKADADHKYGRVLDGR